jgi:putative copper resistance protein D
VEARVDDPLIYVRAIHFAATITAVGAIFFSVLIAEPLFSKLEAGARGPAVLRAQFAWIVWIGLAVAVVSGAVWFVLVAQSMSDSTLADIFSEDVLWTVLLQTGFGRDWLARFILACLLAAILAVSFQGRGKRPLADIFAVVLAGGLVGTLAFAGHAVGARGVEGIVHPAADFMHLIAAAAWIGMLLPLALFLAAVARDEASIGAVYTVAKRFSNVGLVTVGVLLITGCINALYLAGSIFAITETDYGRLLLIKVALFLLMIAIAAINRQVWTPRLIQDLCIASGREALSRLRRNAAIEAGLGAVIIVIVAVLGVTPPGLHQQPMPEIQHHSH